MEHLTWWGVFLACFTALSPFLVLFLALHFQNRSDKKKSDKQLEISLSEYGFHDHNEKTGQLTVDGIRRPRA